MANNESKLNVYAMDGRYVDTVKSSEMAKSLFSNPKNALICIDKKTTEVALLENSADFPLPKTVKFSRVLVLFTELPVRTDTIKALKDWMFKKGISTYAMDFLRIGDFTASYVEGRILRHCRNWDRTKPEFEGNPDERWKRIGGLVELPGSNVHAGCSNSSVAKDSPELLTTSFGSMGEFMLRIHDVANRFLKMKKEIGFTIRERQAEIAKFLENPSAEPVGIAEQEWPVDFPKLLLYGETGVGKSLVSRYLHKQISAVGRPLRISIPEFIGKEEFFEYALFGYAKGTYTGGLRSGSPGLLVKNMGKVVFLDEIEEANNTLQAKLLAFMDDYRVMPRGWLHGAFYCPVLIVAATNCSVQELKKRHFREDLLNRFTDVETIPPLRDRKESMDFIIDCLLQQTRINPEMEVKQIGKYALAKLKGHSYAKGNFRELEDVLRNACASARRDGRAYLCECDIVFD